jgi:hypothetical protein
VDEVERLKIENVLLTSEVSMTALSVKPFKMMNITELRFEAKKEGIINYSKMNKEDLLNLLETNKLEQTLEMSALTLKRDLKRDAIFNLLSRKPKTSGTAIETPSKN